jgi:hypothetical protein
MPHVNGTMLPQHVFQLFAREEVEAVLIGGLAAVLLGVPIVTGDMDFCYDPALPNLSRLVRALAPLHPRLRVARPADEEARALPFHWDERTLQDSPILTLQTDAGPLDLMDAVPGVGTYVEVRAMAVGVDLSGVRVMTLDLPALIASKRAVGRTKDLLVLPQIEAALRLRDAEQERLRNERPSHREEEIP